MDMLFTSGDVEVPACLKITPAYLQHVKGWVKSLQGFPSQLDTRAVGNYLLGGGFTQDQVVKYKTNRAWDHKRGIHSEVNPTLKYIFGLFLCNASIHRGICVVCVAKYYKD